VIWTCGPNLSSSFLFNEAVTLYCCINRGHWITQDVGDGSPALSSDTILELAPRTWENPWRTSVLRVSRSGRKLNRPLADYKSDTLPLEPACSVPMFLQPQARNISLSFTFIMDRILSIFLDYFVRKPHLILWHDVWNPEWSIARQRLAKTRLRDNE
jgi:hypothetical protein